MMTSKQIKLRLQILLAVICIAGIAHWFEVETFKPTTVEFPVQLNELINQ